MTWDAARTGRTIADGLRVQAVGELNWRHITAYVDDVVTVSEEAIRSRHAPHRRRLQAGLRAQWCGQRGRATSSTHSLAGRGPAVAVVSGGNVDPRVLAETLARRLASSPP